MDKDPKTRQESKKNQGKKGRPEKLGTGKGTRIKLANLERAAAAADAKKKGSWTNHTFSCRKIWRLDDAEWNKYSDISLSRNHQNA